MNRVFLESNKDYYLTKSERLPRNRNRSYLGVYVYSDAKLTKPLTVHVRII